MTCATTRSRSWTRSCPPSPPCTRTAAASRPSASSPSPTSSRATCTPGSTTWPSTRCGAAGRTRPRFTTGTSATCRRCSGWPSGRRRAGSSRRPPTFPPCPSLFSTYPDARVVITHRDPLRVIGSLADLMATLHYMHSDHVDHAVLVEFMAMGLEMQMDHVTAERDAGDDPERPDRRRRLPRPGGGPRRRDRGALRRVGPPASATSSAPPSRRTWPPVTPRARRRPRLLLRRHRARPGDAPGARRALPGALRRPLRGARGMDWKLENIVVPVVGRRPGQGLLRRRRRLPRRRGPPGRRGLPGRPADPAGIGLLHRAHAERAGGGDAAGAAPGGRATSTRHGASSRDGGVAVSDVFHFEDGVQVDGPGPGRADYGSFLSFSDPDGNGWLVQEVPSRAG